MKVKFHLGEVIKNNDVDSYEQSPTNIYSIMVRTYSEGNQELYCRPANSNIKQIPLVGEHVLIFQGTNEYAAVGKSRRQWYYFPAYGVQSAINHNALPGIIKAQTSNVNLTDSTAKLGESFKQRGVSSLQQFEGDVIVEGRFSNSIRLGSTVKGGKYTLQPSWKGKIDGDPIIIISNAHVDKKNKKFTIENIKDDASSIYLTSQQQLQDLKLYNNVSKSSSPDGYKHPQLVGTANRIILVAKTDSIILDSPQLITLSAPETRIGNEDADHPFVKGDELKEILNNLIMYMQSGVKGPAGMYSYPDGPTNTFLNKLKIQISKMNSTKHFFHK